MEGLGQKNGDGRIVFCSMLLPVESAIPGKASNSKRPAFHAIVTAACRLMRISQNSSAFGDVRCVIARAKIENCRSRREAFGARRCPRRANGENLCSAGRHGGDDRRILSGQTTFKFDDNCFCLYRCVSVADQMQFFTDAQLSPNMRTQIWSALWRPIRQARPTEQQPVIMLRRMAQRNPSQARQQGISKRRR